MLSGSTIGPCPCLRASSTGCKRSNARSVRARPLHASSRARRTTRASKDVGCAVGQHSVRSFLRQRTLALTGATGFLAKVFLEKLLWEQPGVRKVFLIITPRGKQSAKARLLEDIVETPLFDRLRNRHGMTFSPSSMSVSSLSREILARRVWGYPCRMKMP